MDACAFMVPMPILLIGTFNKNRQANISTTTYGGICAIHPPCFFISMEKKKCAHRDIIERKAFTVNIPDTSMVNKVDYARCYKPYDTNLAVNLDLTARTADHVDAPFFVECPVVIELLCTHIIELGSHTNFIAEIMDVKVKQYCLDENNIPDINSIDPLIYVPLAREYWSTGNLIAKAFSTGTKMFKDAIVDS